LQPIFIISAFEKNDVDYDRFQYYNMAIDDLNEKNNYNPLLTISNKPVAEYRDVFENFILYFNARLEIQENSHNYLNRGIFNSLTGNYNSALADLNKAIELDDKNGVSYFTRANCRFKMLQEIELLSGSESEFSIPINQRISENNNAAPEASVDYKQILDDYEITLFLNPKFFFGYYNRAYIKLRLKEYKSAIEDLNHAIELEPEFAEAYFNRGLTKIYLDDIEGGALDLSRAGELGLVGAYNIIKRYCN
jgi:tetratricopeptide (TPR) repeat protein